MESEVHKAAHAAVTALVAGQPMPTGTRLERQAALVIMGMPPSWHRNIGRERDRFEVAQMRARCG